VKCHEIGGAIENEIKECEERHDGNGSSKLKMEKGGSKESFGRE